MYPSSTIRLSPSGASHKVEILTSMQDALKKMEELWPGVVDKDPPAVGAGGRLESQRDFKKFCFFHFLYLKAFA